MATDILPTEYVAPGVEVGANAYALAIVGDALAPVIRDGQRAVFDPDAGLARAGEVVAVWLHGRNDPIVIKLKLAVPPAAESDELEPVLVEQGGRVMSMSRVARIDRLVEVMEASHG